MESKNQFISSEMVGVATPEVPQVRPTWVRPVAAANHADGHAAIASVVESHAAKTLDEFYNRPLADAQASVLCRDAWGRKVEVHADGWEQSRGIERRFHCGDLVFLVSGIMAHSLTSGSVYGNEPTYMQLENGFVLNPELQDKFLGAIETCGTVAEGQTKKNIPAPISCRVVGQREITIGLCPVYEIEVMSGPLTGLKLLEFPNQVTTLSGIDGYGNPHKVKTYFTLETISKDITNVERG